MSFDLLPILDTMIDFYQKPRDLVRFQNYLNLLQGDTKGDLALPIGGFNPMAKPHVLAKLLALKNLDAEAIMADVAAKYRLKNAQATLFKLALTLADDAQGGWTNRYTTDFDSKLKLNPLITRQFCTPVFWTSESYDATLIRERTTEYILRTSYWLEHKAKPTSLREHIEQEQFVAKNTPYENPKPTCDMVALQAYSADNADSEDYTQIFNFFYGDAASLSLGFKIYGIAEDWAGFKFARY
jgi:hypothetical protein